MEFVKQQYERYFRGEITTQDLKSSTYDYVAKNAVEEVEFARLIGGLWREYGIRRNRVDLASIDDIFLLTSHYLMLKLQYGEIL